MSKGRKISINNNSDWETVFYNSVGTYVQFINIQLSKEYQLEPLSNHLKIVGGYAFKTNEYKSFGIPIIRISDFNNEQIVLKDVVYYEETKELEKYELVTGDIIIALTGGTIAKLAIVQEGLGKIYLNQRVGKFQVLKPNEFEVEYIYWLARSIQSIIKSLAWGAAIPNVSPKQIEELKFPFPTKEIQRGIIDFLNDLKNNNLKEDKTYFDELIEKEIISLHKKQIITSTISTELTHQLSLVKKLRQQFLQDAVQGKLTADFRSSHPELVEGSHHASELLKKIKAEKQQLIAEGKLKKEKPLPLIKPEEIPFEIPDGWVWCRLGEICNYGSSPKAEPKDLNNETWVLDLEDIEKETSKLLCKIRFKERNSLSTKSVFIKGQVLYSKLRPYLDKVIVADESGVCTTEILPLKLYGELNPYFIKFTLKRIDFLKYVNSVTKGMKMPRLGTINGQMALIPLPPLSEQQRIVQKLDELMQTCDALETSIKESVEQNEKLLQVVLREALQG